MWERQFVQPGFAHLPPLSSRSWSFIFSGMLLTLFVIFFQDLGLFEIEAGDKAQAKERILGRISQKNSAAWRLSSPYNDCLFSAVQATLAF
jgi:hypothetical protein